MALITVTEAKAILQITDSTYDTVLGALIPSVTYQVVYAICQNKFLNPKVYISASTFTFDQTNNKITDSDSKFLDSYFYTGSQDISITGSYYNDGVYETASVSANELVIEKGTLTRSFTDEAEGAYITIQRIDYPQALKVTVAKWLNYLIQKDNLRGVSSEAVLSYRVQYTANMPKDVRNEFNHYRRLSW